MRTEPRNLRAFVARQASTRSGVAAKTAVTIAADGYGVAMRYARSHRVYSVYCKSVMLR